jgi:hypothetical protein
VEWSQSAHRSLSCRLCHSTSFCCPAPILQWKPNEMLHLGGALTFHSCFIPKTKRGTEPKNLALYTEETESLGHAPFQMCGIKHLGLVWCCRIHLNPHMLRWIGLEFSSCFTPIHPDTLVLRWVWQHPNKTLTNCLFIRGTMAHINLSSVYFWTLFFL